MYINDTKHFWRAGVTQLRGEGQSVPGALLLRHIRPDVQSLLSIHREHYSLVPRLLHAVLTNYNQG